MVEEDDNEANLFYEKLKKLNDSSGLTLVFNLRETILDLYLFYKEVTRRGGFNQVVIDRKWDEVASSLDLKLNNDSILLYQQLEKAYQTLIYPYEQTQHYRTPAKTKKLSGSSTKDNNVKLHHSVVSPDELDRKVKKRNLAADTQQQQQQELRGPETSEPKKTNKKPPLPPKGKRLKKEEHDNLVKPRNLYQCFLKAECDRLKKVLGEKTDFVNLRDMASEKWKHFSEADKVRYLQEAATLKLRQEKKEDVVKTATSSEIEREYHVKFDPETGDLVPPPPIEWLIAESTGDIMKRG